MRRLLAVIVVVLGGAFIQAFGFADISPDEIAIAQSPADDNEEFY